MDLINELDFGSFLTYTPRGSSDKAKRSKNLTIGLKQDKSIGNPPKYLSKAIAEDIKKKIEKLPFKDFFGPESSLVPIPKSSLMKTGSLWVSNRVVSALSEQGLGMRTPCLERIRAVPKAATSANENRPKPINHLESITCTPPLISPKKIILVDDVITRGSTMLGCASRLRQIYPTIPIYAFAVVRTISNEEDFQKIENPCIGKIKLVGEETRRTP